MAREARIPVDSPEEFDEWFWDTRPLERPGDTRKPAFSALQAEAPAGLSPGHSIDSDHPPAIKPINAGWYRRRAEDLGDLAAEFLYEGLDGVAYGQAIRAAHYGRIALALYELRRRGEWMVPGHPGNFL